MAFRRVRASLGVARQAARAVSFGGQTRAQLKEAFRITVKLAASDVGPAPTGVRRVIPLTTGGHFECERLRGEVLPVGADWN